MLKHKTNKHNRKRVFLSPHFLLSELLVSNTHPELASRLRPSATQLGNMRYGVRILLEQFRIANPKIRIKVLSGLRSKALNSAVGGTPKSLHLLGCAADIISPDVDLNDLFILLHRPEYPWRELRLYVKKGYIHIGWNPYVMDWRRSAKIIIT